MICYHVIVEGKVQGVFYRASTKSMADRLGIKGWVKNEPDGSVSMELEGPIVTVAEMVKWCRNGPEHAIVKQLHQEEVELGNYEKFDIRY